VRYSAKFRYGRGEWTWMSGADQQCQLGAYGTLGTALAANVLGALACATGWVDKSGDLWLFGGGAAGCVSDEKFNDLWGSHP
jgi:hypothetical protein